MLLDTSVTELVEQVVPHLQLNRYGIDGGAHTMHHVM